MTTMTTKTQTTDRIEKRIEVRAPRARVWRAISDAKEFGTWFGIKLDGAFAAGATVRGRLTMPNYDHLTLDMQVERIEPEHYFSYRWHPYAIDPKTDYSTEPMTLVEFHLDETAEGTAVTITESGFDRIPLARRSEAFRMNTKGWDGQSQKLARYVA
ncbi:MAG: SRPBCC family protein [Gemmatimonadales bacterium]